MKYHEIYPKSGANLVAALKSGDVEVSELSEDDRARIARYEDSLSPAAVAVAAEKAAEVAEYHLRLEAEAARKAAGEYDTPGRRRHKEAICRDARLGAVAQREDTWGGYGQ